jgi:hypothetical protein
MCGQRASLMNFATQTIINASNRFAALIKIAEVDSVMIQNAVHATP